MNREWDLGSKTPNVTNTQSKRTLSLVLKVNSQATTIIGIPKRSCAIKESSKN